MASITVTGLAGARLTITEIEIISMILLKTEY